MRVCIWSVQRSAWEGDRAGVSELASGGKQRINKPLIARQLPQEAKRDASTCMLLNMGSQSARRHLIYYPCTQLIIALPSW